MAGVRHVTATAAARRSRDMELVAAYVEAGGSIVEAAAIAHAAPTTVARAVEGPIGIRLISEGLRKRELLVDAAFDTLHRNLQARKVIVDRFGSEHDVEDARTQVVAAGKILDVALKVDEITQRVEAVAGRRPLLSTGSRPFTPDELLAMSPPDRMAAVMEQRRVLIVEEARLTLEAATAGAPDPPDEADEAQDDPIDARLTLVEG